MRKTSKEKLCEINELNLYQSYIINQMPPSFAFTMSSYLESRYTELKAVLQDNYDLRQKNIEQKAIIESLICENQVIKSK